MRCALLAPFSVSLALALSSALSLSVSLCPPPPFPLLLYLPPPSFVTGRRGTPTAACALVVAVLGYLAHKKHPPSQDPPRTLDSPTVGTQEGAASYEGGTPVADNEIRSRAEQPEESPAAPHPLSVVTPLSLSPLLPLPSRVLVVAVADNEVRDRAEQSEEARPARGGTNISVSGRGGARDRE